VGPAKGAGPCGFGGTAGCAVKIDGTGAAVGVISGTSGQPDRIQHCFGQYIQASAVAGASRDSPEDWALHQLGSKYNKEHGIRRRLLLFPKLPDCSTQMSLASAESHAIFGAVGANVGAAIGCRVGDRVGAWVGDGVGASDGRRVGDKVGPWLGTFVGDRVGLCVGVRVGD